MYSIKIWNNENSQPETREGLPYGLAYALAVNAGFAKCQVINEFGIIEFEHRKLWARRSIPYRFILARLLHAIVKDRGRCYRLVSSIRLPSERTLRNMDARWAELAAVITELDPKPVRWYDNRCASPQPP